ncbi:hypothetical protein HMPREF0063_12793 [Aeromicrobium marinum DSM 15272]|uniref:DUF4244 domain-containing protein n=1 Tax=Aeromicrobium marinum DSM 15272 TaxID=585531 RepID=E2SFI4_9ACTN|nr:DUF4244 domain-containing protein [Aeromicrobium marinum]EFQ82085.1 hypothetical protein HMPREF0063_12793 [Aeromicrobium marinum DSM 15272]
MSTTEYTVGTVGAILIALVLHRLGIGDEIMGLVRDLWARALGFEMPSIVTRLFR